MVNGKFISVGEIVWKVLRNPLTSDLSYDQAAEFTIEFLRMLKAPLSFENKVESLNINDYKSKLPNSLIDIRGVRYTGLDGCSIGSPMRYATNTFHVSHDYSNCENTYIVQNCNIITSQEKGVVEIAYTSLTLDSQGFPMIPNNESVKFGLEYFIMWRYLEPLWIMGKIQDKVFSYIEQKKHWYFGQAENSMKLQGVDQLESVMNAINRILIQDGAFKSSFANIGEKEYIKKYN